MAATLHLEIVTPGASIFSGDVDSVLLPGAEGDMGILPQHEMLITELKAGELQIVQKGQIQILAIGEGFAEITGTSVNVITDGAVEEKEIDEQKAVEAVKRAEELLKNTELHGDELDAVQAELSRSLAQITVRRRRHHA